MASMRMKITHEKSKAKPVKGCEIPDGIVGMPHEPKAASPEAC